MEFVFERPDGFSFKAGHFVGVTLLKPSEEDSLGNLREFSFVSSPYETHLSIAARLSDSAYKRSINELSVGELVRLDGPYGEFVCDNNETKPIVFLSGGIGVAPARSIVRQLLLQNSQRKMILVHINQSKEYAPYETELLAAASEHTNLTYLPIYTRAEGKIEKNRICSDVVQPLIGTLQQPLFYISGTQRMVRGIKQDLLEIGVDKNRIRTEEFGTY